MREAKCGLVNIHHTNKPPSGMEKREWSGNELAYLGAGSAEWTNWARAVMALRSIGRHDVFQLVLGKRGARAGWTDEHEERSYARHIAHSNGGGIFWREAAANEVDSGGPGRRDEHPASAILDQFTDEGIDKAELRKRLDWSASTFRRKWAELENSGRIYLSPISKTWQRK